MSARAPNPFRALGLTPEVLKRVKGDHLIAALVLSQYRALSRVFHPDVGGSPAKFREISLAKEELEDPVKFAEHLEEYLKPRRDRFELAQQELAEEICERARVRSSYENYLFELALNGGFPHPDVRAIIDDTVKNALLRETYRRAGRASDPPAHTFELMFQNGQMSTRSVAFARKGSTDIPSGTYVQDNRIVRSVGLGKSASLHAYEPKVEWINPSYKYIGTVNLPDMSDSRARKASQVALVGNVDDVSFGTFGFDQLFDYIDEFSPEIREDTYVVVLSEDRLLRLAGKVLFVARRSI